MMFSESRSASEALEDRRTQPRPCISSIARFEQRDAGVYIELEAIALSREIPAALRFVADPSVRRVSRNSLLASLQQTEEGVRGSIVNGRHVCRRSGKCRTTAGLAQILPLDGTRPTQPGMTWQRRTM